MKMAYELDSYEADPEKKANERDSHLSESRKLLVTIIYLFTLQTKRLLRQLLVGSASHVHRKGYGIKTPICY